MMEQLSLIATSAFGLEAVVKRELSALGYEPGAADAGRIFFRGPLAAIPRTNLWLRSADRVLLHVGTCRADDFDQLFDNTRALPWHQWLPADAAFPVRGKSVRSKLTSVPAVQRTVKKAIVEKLQDAHGTAKLPETGAKFQVEVALLQDSAILTIDASGNGLHKRGYRTHSGPAPLKETLAAGLLQLSFWQPGRPLLDPFCGTGTIPVEAAMIARNMAPGRRRHFAAETWPWLPAELWQQARDEAADLQHAASAGRIVGSDSDGGSLKLAEAHAVIAEVAGDIHFRRRDFADLHTGDRFGCLVANPPYGERLDNDESLHALYRDMPEVLARLDTWSHFILTSYPNFESIMGRKADKRRKLYNGRLACTYFQFHGPPPGRDEPDDAEALRPAFGQLPADAAKQAGEFRSRLQKRARHLRRWPGRGITCYRLYDRDVPGVPLVIDRYDDCVHISQYRRSEGPSSDGYQAWLDLMISVVAEVLEVTDDRIFVKERQRQSGARQHERVSDAGFDRIVEEDGLKFRVNLSDYTDTGLFLDHRITRSLVRERAAGGSFLNLFGYTGAFTVYAAAGGAAATTTVDLSATYLRWAEENMRLNEFTDARQHRFVRGDAMTFIRELPETERFDLVVVDPPTFSNSKAMTDIWDVQRDHGELLNLVLSRTAVGGVVFFSTNYRKFKLDAEPTGCDLREITRQTMPEDFNNNGAHRCWLLTRKE